MDWAYFEKFEPVNDKYLPAMGEGENMATQIVTAVNKLVYKWYNDGDVYDNTHILDGWCNDLSSYANWLRKYIPGAALILDRIERCYNDSDYEALLADLCEFVETEENLTELHQREKVGSIYKCSGPYRFTDGDEEEY